MKILKRTHNYKIYLPVLFVLSIIKCDPGPVTGWESRDDGGPWRFYDYYYSTIYSIGIDEKNKTVLYADTGTFRYPQFSNEDKVILFVHGTGYFGERGVFLFDTNEQNLIYAEQGTEPKFSYDRKKFIYKKVTDFPNDELYIVNLDGIEHSKITNGYRPVFSPDDKSIIFEKVEANNHGYLINYIFSYNLFYKTSQKLTRGLMAKISPDGSKILYIDHNYLEEDLGSYRGELLYLADVNGQNPKLIVESDQNFTDYFRFLPNGSIIYYDETKNNWQITDTTLTHRNVFQEGEPYIRGNFSPDGSLVTYDYQGDVYVMNIDGSNKKSVAEGNSPSFSSDGSKIIYTHSEGRYLDNK